MSEQFSCFETLVQLKSILEYVTTNIELLDVITAAKYYMAVLKGEQPSCPSVSYVEKLFDSYAPTFEEHLTTTLRYEGPMQLQKELQIAVTQTKLSQFRRAADLGCGTGLMGPLLRNLGPPVQWLEGVDVSMKMLEKAAGKGYDVLLKADFKSIFRPLASETHEREISVFPVVGSNGQESQSPHDVSDLFDLVTAVDVAEYIGDLEGIFETAKRWMSSEGLLGLTVLLGDSSEVFDEYMLVPPGLQYIHRPLYVRRLAQKYHFRVLREKETVLRHQAGKPVRAQLFVLQRQRHAELE